MKKYIPYILLGLCLTGCGFLLAKYLHERSVRKAVEHQYTSLKESKTDTVIFEKWKEVDTAGLIKWYLTSVPMKSYSQIPSFDTIKPGETIPLDTCIGMSPKLETIVDTFDRRDFYMMYTIRTWGNLESFRVNKHKVKLIDTTFNSIVYDTIRVPYPVIKSHFGGYAGLMADNFKEFPGVEAGIWYEYKNKWGIEAGALYIDKKIYGSVRARFTLK